MSIIQSQKQFQKKGKKIFADKPLLPGKSPVKGMIQGTNPNLFHREFKKNYGYDREKPLREMKQEAQNFYRS